MVALGCLSQQRGYGLHMLAATLENLSAIETDAAQESASQPGAMELFARLLDTLAPPDRMVIKLLILEERSVAEVSQLTGWSKTLVKVRAFRARLKLKRALVDLEKGKP